MLSRWHAWIYLGSIFAASICVAGCGHDEPSASPHCRQVIDWIESEKRVSGLAPPLDSLEEKLQGAKKALSREEERVIWRVWKEAQTSPVSNDKLIGRLAARREGIENARLELSVEWRKPAEKPTAQGALWQTYSITAKRERCKIVARTGISPDNLSQVTTEVEESDGSTGSYSVLGAGEPDYLEVFFGGETYWPRSMIQRILALCSLWQPADELYDPYSCADGWTVLEHRENVRGREAVVVADYLPPSELLFFDPVYGYALVRSVERPYVSSSWSREKVVMEAYDFTKFGEDLWLPRRIVLTRYAQDDPASEEITAKIEITELLINQPVADEELKITYEPGSQEEMFAKVLDAVGDAGKKAYNELPEEEKEKMHREALEQGGFRVLEREDRTRRRLLLTGAIIGCFLLLLIVLALYLKRLRRLRISALPRRGDHDPASGATSRQTPNSRSEEH